MLLEGGDAAKAGPVAAAILDGDLSIVQGAVANEPLPRVPAGGLGTGANILFLSRWVVQELRCG